MERTNLSKFIVLVVMPALGFLGSNMAFGQSPLNSTIGERAIELRNLLASIEGVSVEAPRIDLTKDGYLRFIMAPPGTHFGMAEAGSKQPEEIAEAFLRKWRGLFVTESSAVDFDAIRTVTRTGYTYVRYQQKYAGLEVFTAQMIVEVTNNGGIGAVMSDIMTNTDLLDSGQVSLNPSIEPWTAQTRAVEWLRSQYKGLELESSTPSLMIFHPQVVGWKGEVVLAWHTIVSNVYGPSVQNGLLVDAHSGQIVFNYSLVFPARYREVYDAGNTSADPGTLRRAEGDPVYGLDDVDRAYDYMGDSYTFYLSYHGRDSYDNNGSAIEATVRYCDPGKPCPWWGAFWSWDKERMYIGQGCVTDDTVGHEFTHGVTDSNDCSQLTYAATESGAIHESFCDMWGEWIDQTYNHNNDQYAYNDDDDSEAAKWYLFEDDIYGAFRNMKNPHEFGHPAKLYEQGFWYYGSDLYDFTHKNNGVGNKLCYLLTDGDSFNNYQISGMGITKTADLFYYCQTNLLTSSAEYYDLGNALIWAACRIALNPDERKNVRNASAAVAILANPEDCYPVCDPSYPDWVVMGKPNCWCGIYGQPPWPYQCDGDADGMTSPWPFYYRVYTGDLALIVNNWEKRIDDPTLNPCADVDHKDSGFPFYYRVYTNDLSTVVANWKKKDADLPGDCPRCDQGQQAKAGGLTFEDLVKWLEDVWLDPEVRQAINEDAWLKFIESLMEEMQHLLTKPN